MFTKNLILTTVNYTQYIIQWEHVVLDLMFVTVYENF